jgi:hypothetical protein
MNAVFLTKPIVAFLLSALIGGSGSNAGTAGVTYIPVNDSQGVFHVVYDNTTGSRFVLQILDQEGNELYQKVFKDKNFNRNFQLADPESYHRLKFVIRNLGGDHSFQSFEVEASTHLVEDVNVQEVKN